MDIRIDDLRSVEIEELLQAHLNTMKSLSPPENVHALDLEALRAPDVTFWSVWVGSDLVGCGALKEFEPGHGEIKSMHTAEAHRGKGIARALVRHILDEASARNYHRLSLETGSPAPFEPARALYRKIGFVECPPFGDYADDPFSVFMTLELTDR